MILRDVSIEIQERIENWAVWCIERQPRRSCRSIEGRYRPEGGDRDIPVLVANPLDAVVIERAMVKMPNRERALLKAHFVERDKDGRRPPVIDLRKRFAIRFGMYESEIWRAIRMVENTLKTVESK